MADTLGDLKALIQDDLNRSDLASQIATEIASAIAQHQSKRFYFNEENSLSFATVSGREWYGSADNSYIPDLLEIDSIRLLRSGSRYTLTPRNFTDIENIAVLATATGQPGEYSYYNRQLRLYPIPNEAYPVNVSAVVRLPALTDDTSTNAWTKVNDAAELIRYEAEYRIYAAIIKDQEGAATAAGLRDAALMRLESETNRRIGVGRVRPTNW